MAEYELSTSPTKKFHNNPTPFLLRDVVKPAALSPRFFPSFFADIPVGTTPPTLPPNNEALGSPTPSKFAAPSLLLQAQP